MNTHTAAASAKPVSHGRHMLEGAVRVFLAEALFPLTGLITAGFLTRRLGAADYGLLTLASTLIGWGEFCVNSLFSRGTIKVISDAKDWRPVGAAIVRLQVAMSVLVMLLIWAVAGPVATFLKAPALLGYLLLNAMDVPVHVLGAAHQQILVGRGAYRERAIAGGSRWIARLVLIILLVELGLSVPGAILASIGASVVEFLVGRFYIRPSLWGRPGVTAREIWHYAVPLFLAALSLRLFRVDLFAVKALGGSAADAGFYGAAQNLAFLPNLIGLAVAPLLLSTLSRVLREGDNRHARDVARDVMRLIILALPLWGMATGAADEIVRLVFGRRFSPAAPLLSPLLLASLSLALISIAISILTAAGKPNRAFWLVGPLVPLAIGGHLWLVPRWGTTGASTVTVCCAVLGALGMMAAVFQLWRIAPPWASVRRSALLSALAYASATVWPTTGMPLVVKLAMICVVVLAGYLVLGEFNARERALAWSLLPWTRQDRPA